MRAVLEWNDLIQDLDLWSRPHGCAEEVQKYYGHRSKLIDDDVFDLESQSCSVHNCVTRKGSRETAIYKKTGHYRCKTYYNDQFSKWVFFMSRQVKHLDKRIDRKNKKVYVPDRFKDEYGEWNHKNSITLNLDDVNGMGPETMTYTNIPPGTYQIAVEKYSAENETLQVANPVVNIYIGASGIKFECRIDPSCKYAATMWNVADVEVIAVNETYYRVQIRNSALKPLRAIDMPTNGVIKGGGWRGKYFEPYYTLYTDEYLSKTCQGRCELTPSTPEVYKQCLIG